MQRRDNSSMNAILFLVALNILVFFFRLIRPELTYFLGLTPAFVLQHQLDTLLELPDRYPLHHPSRLISQTHQHFSTD